MKDVSDNKSSTCPIGMCIYCFVGITHTRHIIRKTKTEYEQDLKESMYRFLLDH